MVFTPLIKGGRGDRFIEQMNIQLPVGQQLPGFGRLKRAFWGNSPILATNDEADSGFARWGDRPLLRERIRGEGGVGNSHCCFLCSARNISDLRMEY